jgi:hypothetical protein
MLIGFLGCPCSGKTTTAAKAFADLKDMGVSAEFIPEQARLYIATKRFLDPGEPVLLGDEDQLHIMKKQELIEKIMVSGAGATTVVIADSTVLNTLLYMTPETRASEDVQEIIQRALARYDLIFYCSPVKPPLSLDPNRIHDEQQSLALDQMIPEILRQFAPHLETIMLWGDSNSRYHVVTRTVLERLVG